MQKGFAIIYVLLLIGLITSMVVTLGFIFITRIRISTEAQDSLRAIYAADSGLEWKLYERRIDPLAVVPPEMDNGTSFSVDFQPVGTFQRMRSRGRYPATGSMLIIRRALEVTNFE